MSEGVRECLVVITVVLVGWSILLRGGIGITAMISLSPVVDGNVGSGSGEYDMVW